MPDVARADLVLLPGLLCDSALWAPQLQGLRACARMTVPDLTPYDSIEAMARAVLASAPRRFALAGLSMGGRVALEVCRTAPERVRRLALLNTGYAPAAAGEWEPRQALVVRARAAGLDSIVDDWIAPMVSPRRLADDVLVGTIRAMVGRMTASAFKRQIAALLTRPDAEPVLRTINCPTLVVAGRDDRWAPAERHAVMAGIIGGAKLAVIEDCGHFSTLENPGAVNAALRGWLGNGASAAARCESGDPI